LLHFSLHFLVPSLSLPQSLPFPLLLNPLRFLPSLSKRRRVRKGSEGEQEKGERQGGFAGGKRAGGRREAGLEGRTEGSWFGGEEGGREEGTERRLGEGWLGRGRD
jgi:hypothetical protein